MTVDLGGDLSVLGLAAVDDVHSGHDLDPAGQRRPDAVGQGQDVVEGTVDPVSHPDAAVLGLDVDVRRPVAKGLGDHEIDDPHDGGVVGGGALGRRHHPAERLGDLEGVEHLADAGDGPVAAVDGAADVRRRGHHHPDLTLGRGGELGLVGLVHGIGQGDDQAPVLNPQRDGRRRAGQILGQAGQSVGLGLRLAQVDEGHPQLDGEHLVQIPFTDRPELDQQHAQALARRGLLEQRLVELRGGEQAGVDEELAERAPARRGTRRVGDRSDRAGDRRGLLRARGGYAVARPLALPAPPSDPAVAGDRSDRNEPSASTSRSIRAASAVWLTPRTRWTPASVRPSASSASSRPSPWPATRSATSSGSSSRAPADTVRIVPTRSVPRSCLGRYAAARPGSRRRARRGRRRR